MHICFLDIDGTLILTGGVGHTAFAQTLAEDFGIPQIDGGVCFAGRSDRAIAMDLFRRHDVEPSVENWLRFYAGYLSRLDHALSQTQGYVLPGVPAFLGTLADRGDVALGLLTGNVREGARRKLEHYELWHWFAFGGYGDNHTERCDIAAAALADAKKHLNDHAARSALGEVVVIGDTVHDIHCARAIGAKCVAVSTGHTTADELREGKPDVLVETLEDIHPVLSFFNE